jgi:hypothetical protein
MAEAGAPGGMVEGLRKKKDSAPRTKRPLDSSQGGYFIEAVGINQLTCSTPCVGRRKGRGASVPLSHPWGAG